MASAPDKPSREQLEADWWKRWWAYDYSWEGLAKKRIKGHGGLHGERTLQDYWRRDPANPSVVRDDAAMEAVGELIRAPDGKLWHLAHVPVFWVGSDLRDTIHRAAAAISGVVPERFSKSTWDDLKRKKLRDLVTARLSAGKETKADNEFALIVSGLDGRAQLTGAVFAVDCLYFPTRDTLSTIHANFSNAWFYALFVGGLTFGPLTSFDRAIFSGVAWFDRATFSGTASFSGAIFSGGARFDRAVFSWRAYFDNAAFSDGARFDSATFARDAGFDNATFSGYARFDSAIFKKGSTFARAVFSWYARFDGATFSGGAWFLEGIFSGYADFRKAIFSNDAHFDDAIFSRVADFARAIFSGVADFARVIFSGPADFNGATFSGDAGFDSATFSGDVWFREATFGCQFRFINARMQGICRFDGTIWPTEARYWHSAFDGAIFSAPVSFRGAKRAGQGANETFIPHAAFDGATFERPPAFDLVTEAESKANFKVSLDGAIKAAKAQADEWADAEYERVKNKPSQNSADVKPVLPPVPDATLAHASTDRHLAEPDAFENGARHWRHRPVRTELAMERSNPISSVRFTRTRQPRHPWFETGFLGALADWRENVKIASEREDRYKRHLLDRLAELERGCRVLKTEMAKATDKTREQMFFRYELRARREQASTPWEERFASASYYYISDYGASPVWPLIWLGVSAVVFAILYLLLGIAGGYQLAGFGTDLMRAFEISMSSVLRPFQTLVDSGVVAVKAPPDLHDVLLGNDILVRVAAKFLSGVQSFSSLVLLFLFALALRRRFQIN
jgi:uncharacterized protein YjbI with pentapeptide repeats